MVERGGGECVETYIRNDILGIDAHDTQAKRRERKRPVGIAFSLYGGKDTGCC